MRCVLLFLGLKGQLKQSTSAADAEGQMPKRPRPSPHPALSALGNIPACSLLKGTHNAADVALCASDGIVFSVFQLLWCLTHVLMCIHVCVCISASMPNNLHVQQ